MQGWDEGRSTAGEEPWQRVESCWAEQPNLLVPAGSLNTPCLHTVLTCHVYRHPKCAICSRSDSVLRAGSCKLDPHQGPNGTPQGNLTLPLTLTLPLPLTLTLTPTPTLTLTLTLTSVLKTDM